MACFIIIYYRAHNFNPLGTYNLCHPVNYGKNPLNGKIFEIVQKNKMTILPT